MTHFAGLSRIMNELADVIGAAERPGTVALENGSDRRIRQLTAREREVLALLLRGLANRRIARSLSISEKTVKNHLHAIFGKLGVSDRTQAVAVMLGSSGEESPSAERDDRRARTRGAGRVDGERAGHGMVEEGRAP